jgi:translocation and assembly module TamB
VNTTDPSSGSNGPPSRLRQRLSSRALRTALWIEGILGLTLLLVGIAIAVLINSAAFHQYVITTVQRQASEKLGTGVHLQNFALHLSTLSLELYGVTVDGASPYPNPPLLQVEHAEAGVHIVSILSRTWYLSDVRIDHPVVQIFVDKNGVSNIPTIKSSGGGGSNTTIFDLGIRHALLDHGEVYYNSQASALSADLHDFEFRATFDSLVQTYSGNLAYTDGHLEYGTFHPLPHSFSAQFEASPTTLHLTRANLTCGPSSLAASGTVSNFRNPVVDAQYDVTVDGKQVGQILKNPQIPVGLVRTVGSLHFAQAPSQSALQALTVEGALNSRELNVATSAVRTRVADIDAHYSLANGDVTLRDLQAYLLGGEVRAKGVMKNLGGDSSSNVDANLRNISLAQIRSVLGSDAMRDVTLTGTLNATASASWGKTFDDLAAKADATIDGHVAGNQVATGQAAGQTNTAAPSTSPTSLPLDSVVHATYSAKTQQIALNNSYLRTAQTELTMNGLVGKRSSLALRLQANDLREVATIIDVFQPSTAQRPPFDVAGQASFIGNVQGTTTAPHLTGQLTAANLEFNGTNWKVFKTGIDVSPSHASLQHADLESATRGRVTLNADTQLSKWSFTNASPVSAEVNISQINIAEILKLAGQSDIPATGTLSANLKVHGTELNPVGSGNISLSSATVYEQPIHSAHVVLSGDGSEAHAQFAVELPAGKVEGNASVRPRQKTYTAQLTSNEIRLDKLHVLQASNIEATGVAIVRATGQGTFDNPQLNATLEIPKLTVQHQTISGIKLDAAVANHVANATLVSSAVNTSIRALAKIQLTGDYQADASLDTQSIPLQPLLAVYAPEQAPNIVGQTEVHATLHGPLKNPDLLEAHVTIPTLKLAYSNTIDLAEGTPIRIDYKNGVIQIQPSSIRGTDTNLQFEGSIPTKQNAPMILKVLGTVNLQLAQLFNPDIRTSGELKFNIDSHGTLSDRNIGGQIEIVDANYSSLDLPVGLQHANGVLTMTRDRINIAKFQGTVGGGAVTAQGGVVFSPHIQFDLGVVAKGIRVLYPAGMRETADANLRLTGSPLQANLGGTVAISELSFTPAFDLNSFVGQFTGGVATPPSGGFSQNIALNIAVHSTNNVNLVSRTLSIGGSANLQIRGTAADPVILGRVNLSGGDIILNNSRFVLTAGTVQFINPMETQPVVNMTLNTTIQQYNIHLRFNGPMDQLKTQYTSDPALPQADIINLLAFGETTEAAQNSPTSGNQAAQSLVASQVSSQVTSRISKIAGISQLTINPVLANSSSQSSPGANITIQQRVTGNLFVTFSTNVGSNQNQTIQGQYQVTPRVAISVTSDPNGGFAFDTLIKKSW